MDFKFNFGGGSEEAGAAGPASEPGSGKPGDSAPVLPARFLAFHEVDLAGYAVDRIDLGKPSGASPGGSVAAATAGFVAPESACATAGGGGAGGVAVGGGGTGGVEVGSGAPPPASTTTASFKTPPQAIVSCTPKRIPESPLTPVVSYTDVLPGVYEGGYKLWECAIDLCRWFGANMASCSRPGGRVLELGCGHGLPGVLALKTGASAVVFQDLNPEVLETVTMATVRANCPDEVERSRATYLCGNWLSVVDTLTSDQKFDTMFASETIYNPDTYPVLCRIMDSHLCAGGVALVAAKRYYFGVGGGTDMFQSHVAEKWPSLSTRVELVIEDGATNIREILLVKKRE